MGVDQDGGNWAQMSPRGDCQGSAASEDRAFCLEEPHSPSLLLKAHLNGSNFLCHLREGGRILGVDSGVAMENRPGFLHRVREMRNILGNRRLAFTWFVSLKISEGRWYLKMVFLLFCTYCFIAFSYK